MSIKGDSSDWVLPWRLEPLGLASAVTGLQNCPGSSKQDSREEHKESKRGGNNGLTHTKRGHIKNG